MRQLNARALALAGALAVLGAAAHVPPPQFAPLREVAPGVTLFHLTDPALLDPPGPVSVWLLRLDPARVSLRAALANDEVVGTERVSDTAARHKALAAINAGFFLPSGDPAGLFKMNGRFISDTRRRRGAVGILADGERQSLLFDRVTATVTAVVQRGRSMKRRIAVDGVDTTRQVGRLMLFTPAYHDHSDAAPGGLEWTAGGRPPRVIEGPLESGKTRIPADGFVLSFGGQSPPAPLRGVKRGDRVDLEVSYVPDNGRAEQWAAATDIVGGAGLLARGGSYVRDWSPEKFGPGFAEVRHPRTMIGVARDGAFWLAAVDGRQPASSLGMTLMELQALARQLDLVDALNLDGGGSTTMWVQGEVINRPSDAAGPRRVSDSLLVFPATH